MDSSQPLFMPYYESKDGISSGGSWNLSMLDDNVLQDLTAFNHADDSTYSLFACVLVAASNAGRSAKFN